MKKLLLIAPFILLLNCQKEVLTTVDQTEPVFFVDYEVDGTQNKIEAGVDNNYMFSRVEDDSLGVKNSIGSLTHLTDKPKNAVSFSFRNALANSQDIDSTLSIGQKELVSNFCGMPVSTEFKVKFIPNNAPYGATQHWVIKGNITSYDENPVFTFDTNEVTSIPIYLNTSYNNSCVAASSRCLDFRSLNCYADFNVAHSYGSSYEFSIPNHLLPDIEYVVWYIGSATLTGTQISYTFPTNANSYFIHANVFFKNGCKSCLGKKIEVDINGNLLSCTNDILFEIEEETNYEHLQLNKLEVNYWDENGLRYSSKWASNPGKADIISVENYKINENGLPTKKIHLKGDFNLATISGKQKSLTNVNAVIAIAY